MVELLRSLPQGVYWYPLVLALVIVVVRSVLDLRRDRHTVPQRPQPTPTPLAGHVSLISRLRTDSFAEAELERLCIGLLLQASGYRGYSVDACRRYLAHEAPESLVPIVRAHLGDASYQNHPQEGVLPYGCELILREIEHITEEPVEHHA